MLDDNKPGAAPVPAARHVAQLRMMTQAKGLPDRLADAMAAEGVALATAPGMIDGLAAMIALAAARKIPDAQVQALAETAISQAAKSPGAAMAEIARDVLLAHTAEKPPEIAPDAPSRSVATVGTSWDNPVALMSKIADARAAVIAPMLGVKHEPTMGRDLGSDSLAHARAWTAQMGLRGMRDAEMMDAFVTGRLGGASAVMVGGQHTTSDFPSIAGASVQLVIGRVLEQAPIGLARCVHPISAADWRSRKLVNNSIASPLLPVQEAADLTFGTIDETGETVPAPSNYAKGFTATEQLITNARSGGYELEQAIARALVRSAQESQRTVIAAAITANANMADGNAVFSSAHGNIQGTASAISVTTVGAAQTAMQRFVDSQGGRNPVEPAILLVPPEKTVEAQQVVAQITAAKISDANPFVGKLDVVTDPGLAGTSTYYWYLLGNPSTTDGLAFITLDEMPTPRVESRDAWPNFGQTWRIRWPMAAAFVRASWFRTVGN